MPSVRINDVPTETHAVLRRRAAEANQSLQEYLRAWLIDEASRPTVGELLGQIAHRSGGTVSVEVATQIVHAEREGDRDRFRWQDE
jgi:hypothetical protein